jgi:hypothetical protein
VFAVYAGGFAIAAIAACVGFLVSGRVVGGLAAMAVACLPLMLGSLVSSTRKLMRESRQSASKDETPE